MASNYDSYISTDSRDGADGSLDRASCAALIWLQRFNRLDGYHEVQRACAVPYEEHDNETLGHDYEMPEPEPREY